MKTVERKITIKARLAAIHPARQRGSSLLEGIAYLGVAAVIILGALSLLRGAFGSVQSNQTTTELASIRTAVQKLYMGQGGYGTASMVANLGAAHAFPASVRVASDFSSAANSWGGAVTVTGATNNFKISYAAVPQNVCVETVGGADGWTQISNGTTTVSLSGAPASPDQASTLCNASTNNLTFTSI